MPLHNSWTLDHKALPVCQVLVWLLPRLRPFYHFAAAKNPPLSCMCPHVFRKLVRPCVRSYRQAGSKGAKSISGICECCVSLSCVLDPCTSPHQSRSRHDVTPSPMRWRTEFSSFFYNMWQCRTNFLDESSNLVCGFNESRCHLSVHESKYGP